MSFTGCAHTDLLSRRRIAFLRSRNTSSGASSSMRRSYRSRSARSRALNHRGIRLSGRPRPAARIASAIASAESAGMTKNRGLGYHSRLVRCRFQVRMRTYVRPPCSRRKTRTVRHSPHGTAAMKMSDVPRMSGFLWLRALLIVLDASVVARPTGLLLRVPQCVSPKPPRVDRGRSNARVEAVLGVAYAISRWR